MRYVITVNETDEDRRIKRELADLPQGTDRSRRRELKQHLNRALSTRATALSTTLSASDLGVRVVAINRGEVIIDLDEVLSDERKREIETTHDCTVTHQTEPNAP
jgi:hypothetical protein